MVKTRIIKWNLSKSLRYSEVRTAIELLGADRSMWPEPEPRLIIRAKIVTFHQILLYFKRRGITDPFSWVQQNPDPDFEMSDEVHVFSSGINSSSALVTQRAAGTSSSLPYDTGSGSQLHHSNLLIYQAQGPSDQRSIMDGVRAMQIYCTKYINSVRAQSHVETESHMSTKRGIFEDRMEHGIYLFSQRNYKPAFESFDSAFNEIRPMLREDHPMNLALYLKVVCGLLQNEVTTVLRSLIHYTAKATDCDSNGRSAIVQILGLIGKSEHPLEHVLLTMRAATEVFESEQTGSWKSLYIEERYCDSLYRAKFYGEAIARRRRLLQSQELVYGKNARNVLWTRNSVAHDHLTSLQFREAELHFRTVLHKAEMLAGYGRAKIRFAALEGLARLHKMKAQDIVNRHKTEQSRLSKGADPWTLLHHALGFAHEAAQESQAHFGVSSRRWIRIQSQIRVIEAVISSLGYHKPSSAEHPW